MSTPSGNRRDCVWLDVEKCRAIIRNPFELVVVAANLARSKDGRAATGLREIVAGGVDFDALKADALAPPNDDASPP